MPYEVLANEVQVLVKSNASIVEEEGSPFVNVSKAYRKGEEISDEEISSVVKDQYEKGDKHVRSLLKYFKAEAGQSKKAAQSSPETSKEK